MAVDADDVAEAVETDEDAAAQPKSPVSVKAIVTATALSRVVRTVTECGMGSPRGGVTRLLRK
jgi:hypothetical protein